MAVNPWRKVRLDQDRRVNTAVPHVARPQTLAEQRLLIVGALRLEQRAEVAEDRTVVHVDVDLFNTRLVHLQEGDDLGQVEAMRVRMLRREPAVRQGENGERAPFRLCHALECGHVPERRLWGPGVSATPHPTPPGVSNTRTATVLTRLTARQAPSPLRWCKRCRQTWLRACLREGRRGVT